MTSWIPLDSFSRANLALVKEPFRKNHEDPGTNESLYVIDQSDYGETNRRDS